ncbi:MAG: LamG-like jellyroll fold domain-containing protein [Bacteroidota bacterium]
MKKQLLLTAIAICVFVAISTAQVPSYVPSNGLVGWWPFNGNANDESGTGNNGTVNGVTLATDRFGIANKAYQFGNNKWIAIASSPSLIPSTITICSWVKMDGAPFTDNYNTTSYPIFYKGQYEVFDYDALFFKIKQNSDCGAYSGGGYVPSTTNNNLSYDYTNWHFIVGLFDGSNVKLYVDNVLMQNFPTSTATIDNCSSPGEGFKIGRMHNYSTLFFNGKIDDIGIWNRALTPSEILKLYTDSKTTSPLITKTTSPIITINGVKIGTQTWMKTNLAVTKFGNGDPIEEAKNDEEWQNAILELKPVYRYYEYNIENAKLGMYYNRYAIMDPRGLAPEGWRVPSQKELEDAFKLAKKNGIFKDVFVIYELKKQEIEYWTSTFSVFNYIAGDPEYPISLQFNYEYEYDRAESDLYGSWVRCVKP